MPDYKHVRLLEMLEQAGIAQTVSVSNFLTTNFKRVDFNLIENIGKNQDPAYNFITALEESGYIVLDWHWADDLLEVNSKTKNYVWFDTVELGAFITVKGLDYLSNFRVNESVLISSKYVKWSFWTTFILAGVTAVLTFLTFRKTKSNSENLKVLKQQLQFQSKEIEKIRSNKLLLQSPKASAKDYPRIQPQSSLNRRLKSSHK